jgi:sugar/nucleoside kinase (ribokinase family)
MGFTLRAAPECRYDLVGLGQNSVNHICRVDRYPAVGTKAEARSYDVLPGGQVATAVLAANRQGLRTRYVGAVGDDPLGGLACSVLREAGVELDVRVVDGGRTQFAIIIVDQAGERTIIEHYDPRTVITADSVPQDAIAHSRALHLDITDVGAAVKAAQLAREAGVLVSLDIDRLLPGTEELLGLVDLLVASEGLPRELGAPDPLLALHTLRQHCSGFICVTRGERGCVALEDHDAYWIPAFRVDAVDTTGCGDVFRGVLIHAVLEGRPMRRALSYAAAAAALQASVLGAQAGIPERRAIEAFLADEPPVRDREGR